MSAPSASPSPLRLVEFFSIPGGGKSTIAASVGRACGMKMRADLSADWKAQSVFSKARHIAIGLSDGKCVWAAFVFAVRAPLRNMESLKRLARLVAKAGWLRSQPQALLLDQGFAQDLWSILYAARRQDPDVRLLSALMVRLYRGVEPRIIFLDVEPATAARRVSARVGGDSRLDGLTKALIHQRLDEGYRIPEAIVGAAAAAGISVVRADGARPTVSLAREVSQLLFRVD